MQDNTCYWAMPFVTFYQMHTSGQSGWAVWASFVEAHEAI